MAALTWEDLPHLITQEEISDIKKANAWPIQEFQDPKPKDEEISGNTKFLIKWEENIWINDGSRDSNFLSNALEKLDEKGKVKFINTVRTREDEYTHVVWRRSWVKLSAVFIKCSPEHNKLRRYCVENSLDYRKIAQHGIQSF